jgi:hypothetical protein
MADIDPIDADAPNRPVLADEERCSRKSGPAQNSSIAEPKMQFALQRYKISLSGIRFPR